MRCRTFCKQSFTSVLIVIKLCLALLDYGSFLSLWVAIQNGENCASHTNSTCGNSFKVSVAGQSAGVSKDQIAAGDVKSGYTEKGVAAGSKAASEQTGHDVPGLDEFGAPSSRGNATAGNATGAATCTRDAYGKAQCSDVDTALFSLILITAIVVVVSILACPVVFCKYSCCGVSLDGTLLAIGVYTQIFLDIPAFAVSLTLVLDYDVTSSDPGIVIGMTGFVLSTMATLLYFVYKHCCARSKRRTSAVTPTDADATALLESAEGAAAETGATEAGVKDAGAKDGGVAAGAGAGPGDGARVAAPGVLPPIQRLSTQAGATATDVVV